MKTVLLFCLLLTATATVSYAQKKGKSRSVDCNRLSKTQLQQATHYTNCAAASTASAPVYRLEAQYDGSPTRWDSVLAYPCLQELKLVALADRSEQKGVSGGEVLALVLSSLNTLPTGSESVQQLQGIYRNISNLTSLPQNILNLDQEGLLGEVKSLVQLKPESIKSFGREQLFNLLGGPLDLSKERLMSLQPDQFMFELNGRAQYISQSIKTLNPDELRNLVTSRIQQLPQTMAGINQLRDAYQSVFQLTQLPQTLKSMNFNELLSVVQTQIQNHPESLKHLNNMQTFVLVSNDIRKLQNDLRELGKDMKELNNTFEDLTGGRIEVETKGAPSMDEVASGVETFVGLWHAGKAVADKSKAKSQSKTLPAAIKDLQQLEILDASQLGISKVPDEMTELKQLRVLNLSDNEFDQLPETLTLLSKLEVLDVSNNQLKDLPTEIGRLSNTLRVLNLAGNDIPQARRDEIQKQLLITRITWE